MSGAVSNNRILVSKRFVCLWFFIIFTLSYIQSAKSQQMNDSMLINILNTYCLGDSIDLHSGFYPFDAVKKQLNVGLFFLPFKIDYILMGKELPTGIQHLGISVIGGNIAAVHLYLSDTSSILSTLLTKYGPYDIKLGDTNGDYSFLWKKNPCIRYSNTTAPLTSSQKKTVISIYECDILKEITIDSISRLIKE
jgi:hypothetical protein